MRKTGRNRTRAALLAAAVAIATTGCGTLVSSAANRFADNLSNAILDQDDPGLVRDGAPAYLLLLDSLVQGDPDNPAYLEAASTLYASYGAVFVDDEERARRLTSRARDYGERAMCNTHAPACDWPSLDQHGYVAALAEVKPKHADVLYAYSVSWLAWMRAHGDFKAMAELPRVEAALDRLEAMDVDGLNGNVQLYLGVLNTLRPPALGGDPDAAQAHFERALAETGGRDLSVKVEYARGYARLLYDRELHDRLLGEVMAADAREPGLTLLNVLAQQQAEALLASADDYF